MKNLVTKRRLGVVSLLVALLTAAAGLFVSIMPAQAAAGVDPAATFTSSNVAGTEGTITFTHSSADPVIFYVNNAFGTHQVKAPGFGGTASEPFHADWGHIVVKYLDPATQLFKIAGEYTVPSGPNPTETPDPTPTVTPTTDPLPDDTDRKIGICHASHPRAEAYEPMEVPITAILVGHGQHEGDIIPPFAYVKNGLAGGYPGNRWNEEGIAVYNNGCTVIPITTPSPTETTTPTETAQPSPSETTSPTATSTPTETTSPTASSSPTETATQVPTSAAPSTSQAVIPVKSKTAVATATVSRYPAAVVDTAVKGGGNTASPIASLLFGGAAIALLMALLLFRSGGYEGRRH